MRYLKYITEILEYNPFGDRLKNEETLNHISSILIKECKPFIKEFIKFGREDFLYRGTNNKFEYIKKFKSYLEGRKPEETSLDLHNKSNKLFKEIFGWPVRNGISVTPSQNTANSYGINICLFFPVGQYEYAYNPNIHDFTVQTKFIDDKKFEELLKGYTNKNLKKLFSSKGVPEIMFKCKEYYLIKPTLMKIGLKSKLKMAI